MGAVIRITRPLSTVLELLDQTKIECNQVRSVINDPGLSSSNREFAANTLRNLISQVHALKAEERRSRQFHRSALHKPRRGEV